MKQALLITLTALMLGGCATEEFSTGMTATPHYMASGHVGTAKAWVYAQRTIFEGRAGQELTLPLESVSHNRAHELACLG